MSPGELAEALASLAVAIEAVRCRSALVPLDDYGEPGRPSTLVELSGCGHTGFGELVSFTIEEHQAFAARAPALLARRQGRVEDLSNADPTSHGRAALQGALIDLALRQAGLSLADLLGTTQARLRWVASFAAMAEPAPRLRALAVSGGRPELKLDVHPRWSDETIAALADLDVAILDWKGHGSVELAARLSAAFPRAVFEDPPDGTRHPLIARDRPLLQVPDVGAAAGRGELVNLKGPRMGGFIDLLRSLDHPAVRPGWSYFGGMFEIGPGREQARQLAALFCPHGPNDLAPIAGGRSSLHGASPSLLRLDRIGFGSNVDWSGGPAP